MDRAKVSIAAGVALIFLGLLLNPWLVGRLLSEDGEIESRLFQGTIVVSEAALVVLGAALLQWRDRVPWAELATAGTATALALAAAELLLAAAGYEPQRRRISRIPELAPWFTCDDGERGCHYLQRADLPDAERYNSAGYRDRDEFTAEALGDGRPRVGTKILLLGDSFAYGASAYEEGTSFAEILQDDLAPGTVVWNTGIPASGQRDELLALRTYLPRMEPDLVVLAFYMNDFSDNRWPAGMSYVFADGYWVHRYARGAAGEVRVLDPEDAYRRAFRLPRSAREQPLTSRVLSLVLASFSRLDKLLHEAGRTGPRGPSAGPDPTPTRELLRELADEVEAAGSRLLVLVIPSRGDLPTPGERYRAALAICGELALDCLEVKDVLDPEDYDNDHPLDSHWTAAGHRKAGDVLVRKVAGLFAAGPFALPPREDP